MGRIEPRFSMGASLGPAAPVEPRLTIPAAIKRAAAAVDPAYDAAGSGRRNMNWRPTAAHINAIILGSAGILRDKSRDMFRRNPWAMHGVQSFGASAIGSGIVPQSLHPRKEMRGAIRQLWDRFVAQSDAHGVTDFYGQQRLAVQAVKVGGEVFGRLRKRRLSDGFAVPLQVQLIEAEQVPVERNLLFGANKVRMGIEFDGIGQRVAYHMWKQNPADLATFGGFNELIRVPAGEVLHCFEPLEPSQIRGVSGLATALMRLYEFDQYEDGELTRKRDASKHSGFIYKDASALSAIAGTSDDVDAAIGRFVGTSEDGDATLAVLETGTFQELRFGEKVEFAQAPGMGDGYDAFMKWVLRAIAAAIGITYEQLTGDLTGVNYSSIRAGLIEFRRAMEWFQHSIVVHQFCRPVWEAYCDAAVLSGALPISASDYLKQRWLFTAVKWVPPGWAQVDPLKEILAVKMAIRAGLKSRTMGVAETGYSAEEIDKEIAEDNRRADELGLVFDTDPRRVTGAGVGQFMDPDPSDIGPGQPAPRDTGADEERLAMAIIQQETAAEAARGL